MGKWGISVNKKGMSCGLWPGGTKICIQNESRVPSQ